MIEILVPLKNVKSRKVDCKKNLNGVKVATDKHQIFPHCSVRCHPKNGVKKWKYQKFLYKIDKKIWIKSKLQIVMVKFKDLNN